MRHPEPEPIVIGCAANARYALPLAVTLRSALANLDPRRRLDIYVVADGIEASDQQRVACSLSARATVHWLRPQRSGFSGLPLWGRMSIATYDKLAIAELLPRAVRKIIWIDSDLLVLGDVAQLWDLDTAEHHVLAAQDVIVPHIASRFGVAAYEELGVDGDAKYFNAGVMVINVALWRQEDIGRQALAYLKRYRDRVFFWDQEGLNAVLAGKWGEIDPRWNWNVSIDRLPLASWVRKESADPRIVHFTGHLKPWRYHGGSAHHALYFRYLDMTSWVGWRPRRDWRSAAISLYESSLLRRLCYPAEGWGMQLLRAVTLRNASGEE
ncbi:MAG: glycosyltransferase family 8 protein [Candidatus Binatia bacterium]